MSAVAVVVTPALLSAHISRLFAVTAGARSRDTEWRGEDNNVS